MITSVVRVLGRRVLGLRLRTWLLLALAASLLLWLLLNALFSTKFGTGFIARKIENKIGLPCQIESVTWSPWAGVSVRDFDLYGAKVEPLNARVLRIAEINIDPSWVSLFEGKKRFERLEVIDLCGELSLEQLLGIMNRYQRTHPVEVVITPPKKAPALEGKPVKPSLGPPPKAPEKGKPVRPPQVPTQEKPKKPAPPVAEPEIVPVDAFEGTVVLKNVNLRLYGEKWPDKEVNLRGCGALIPLWGGAREGLVSLGSVEVGDCLGKMETEFPLKWDGDALVMDEQRIKVLGVDLALAGKLRLSRGLPFGMRIDLPDQQMDLSPIYPIHRGPFEVAHLRSQNVLQGSLTSFGSFRGRSVTQFADFIFHDPKDGGDTKFDRGSATMTLTASGLVANDVRAIGEEDSLLMNGYMTMNGAAAATVRVVSSPTRADSHENRVASASPALALQFSPLLTPDREYRDIRIESGEAGLVTDLGVDQQMVRLVPVVRALLEKRPLPAPKEKPLP